MPLVGSVPFGPAETFPGGVTEVAQTPSDKCCALTTKIKRKQWCGFQPAEKQRRLTKSNTVCFIWLFANHSNLPTYEVIFMGR